MPRQIYRIGADIYNAETNQRIGSTDWAQNWSGRSDVQDLGQRPTPTNTPAVVPPAVTPEAPNTPANAYAGVLGTETPEEKAAREFRQSQGAQYQSDANQTVDEEAIRLATEQRFQAEIDALNRVYAEKKNQERLRGQGRLGTDTAIQSRRGLIGSTFGEAQTGKVEAANVQAEEAIQDELSFELSQVRAKIRKEASDEVKAKREAKKAGADNYMTYLTEQAERSRTKVVSAAQRLLAVASKTGTDINWGSTEIADIAKSLKISVEELKNKYEDEKANQEAAAQEAKIKSYQKLGKGESLIDPATGLPVYSPAPEAEKLETQVVDGNLLERQADGTWKTIYAKPADSTKPLTALQQVELESKGYTVDENGNLKKLPASIEATALQKQALESARALLSMAESGKGNSAVGKSSIFQTAYAPGTDAYNLRKQFDNLKSLLSLDNVKYLKGQGQVSDAERRLLADASTKLDRGLDEKEFRRLTAQIVATLSPVGTIVDAGQNKYFYKNNDTSVHEGNYNDNYVDQTGPITDNYSDLRNQLQPGEVLVKDKATGAVGAIPQTEFDPSLYEELSFNKDLSMSQNGSEVKKIASAIGQYESGGNYKAVGPVVTSGQYKGDRAYGKYQIMSKNLPQWSREALGRSITLQEFLNNPQLQDRIAEYKMGKIYQQYGNVGDVASVWFSGRPVAKAGNAKDVIGTTVPKYVSSVNSIYKRLG